MIYLLCLLYVIFSLLGLIFMKSGSMEGKRVIFQIFQRKIMLESIVGYVCYIISFLLYTTVITKFNLSYIIPVLGGIVNILILLIGILLFHEEFTMFSVVGCICIVTGVVLMSLK